MFHPLSGKKKNPGERLNTANFRDANTNLLTLVPTFPGRPHVARYPWPQQRYKIIFVGQRK